jgi:hypothetical protein
MNLMEGHKLDELGGRRRESDQTPVEGMLAVHKREPTPHRPGWRMRDLAGEHTFPVVALVVVDTCFSRCIDLWPRDFIVWL